MRATEFATGAPTVSRIRPDSPTRPRRCAAVVLMVEEEQGVCQDDNVSWVPSDVAVWLIIRDQLRLGRVDATVGVFDFAVDGGDLVGRQALPGGRLADMADNRFSAAAAAGSAAMTYRASRFSGARWNTDAVDVSVDIARALEPPNRERSWFPRAWIGVDCDAADLVDGLVSEYAETGKLPDDLPREAAMAAGFPKHLARRRPETAAWFDALDPNKQRCYLGAGLDAAAVVIDADGMENSLVVPAAWAAAAHVPPTEGTRIYWRVNAFTGGRFWLPQCGGYVFPPVRHRDPDDDIVCGFDAVRFVFQSE